METIAAIATPPGRGGIAVIRISGPESFEIVSKIFVPANTGKAVKNMKGYTALYGVFSWQGKVIDDGILLSFHAPHSYTGEDIIELSCHGGEAVSAELLAACLRAGAQPAMPGEFTRRAVLNGKLSITQAEAVMDLIAANSRLGMYAARAAYDGNLHRAFADMRAKLLPLAAHLAAWSDYPEEDVPPLRETDFCLEVSGVLDKVERMIADFEKGSFIRRGVSAAIAGRPNTGKSTLFNMLCGLERAIVTPVAGTTRDILREEISIGGVKIYLSDTAGLHNTGDLVEKEGIRRTMAEMDQAQLIIAVFDGSKRFEPDDLELAHSCAGRPALAVVNKSDLGILADISEIEMHYGEVIVVSALSAGTCEIVENAIMRLLDLQSIDPNASMLTNGRQLALAVSLQNNLRQALKALELGLALDAAGVCLDDALRALACLTGEDMTESVLDEVFSTFCVGK